MSVEQVWRNKIARFKKKETNRVTPEQMLERILDYTFDDEGVRTEFIDLHKLALVLAELINNKVDLFAGYNGSPTGIKASDTTDGRTS